MEQQASIRAAASESAARERPLSEAPPPAKILLPGWRLHILLYYGQASRADAHPTPSKAAPWHTQSRTKPAAYSKFGSVVAQLLPSSRIQERLARADQIPNLVSECDNSGLFLRETWVLSHKARVPCLGIAHLVPETRTGQAVAAILVTRWNAVDQQNPSASRRSLHVCGLQKLFCRRNVFFQSEECMQRPPNLCLDLCPDSSANLRSLFRVPLLFSPTGATDSEHA